MKRPPAPIKARTVQLRPGLDRAEAFRQARKASPGDARGFTYDRKSGKATRT